MNLAKRLLSRIFGPSEWREIATAPFDRELELAVIGDHIGVLDIAYLRHGNGWLNAETLRPARVNATHWRYARAVAFPMSCC